MNFLGLRITDHDTNVSYSTDNKIRYLKSERLHQVKHHGYRDFWAAFSDTQHWNISDLQAIAISADATNLPFSVDEEKNFQLAPDWFLKEFNCPIYIIEHHLAHALSCWPVKKTEFDFHIVADGFGDYHRCLTIFDKEFNVVERRDLTTHESFGLMLGKFSKNIMNIKGHELDLCGKAMGLQSYGQVNYEIFDEYSKLDDLRPLRNSNIWNASLDMQTKIDYLATLHKIMENTMLNLFKKYFQPHHHISYSGGVAQNTVINRTLKLNFPNMEIPPHCADDGLSLGCVEFLRKIYNQNEFSTEAFPYWQDDDIGENVSQETIQDAAKELSEGKIVAWFQGAGEIGPRALGNRSILLDPRIVNGKEIINDTVKHREWYRPFGATVLKDRSKEFFSETHDNPYMLYVVGVKKKIFPSITHVDESCRTQTIERGSNHYAKLIEEFEKLTNVPILLNTSLNVNGKPIASKKEDAMELFYNSKIDVLYLGNKKIVRMGQ